MGRRMDGVMGCNGSSAVAGTYPLKVLIFFRIIGSTLPYS